jgi:hypothetical protein
MSLKNLQLNPLSVAHLFSSGIISLHKTDVKATENTVAFLGKNLSHITIVVNDLNNFYISEEDLNVLSKMLIACKLTLEHIALINIGKVPTNWAAIKTSLNPQKLILFGVTPTQIELPIIFPEYHLQSYNDTTFLLSDSIENISADKLLKSKLWISLQNLFAV